MILFHFDRPRRGLLGGLAAALLLLPGCVEPPGGGTPPRADGTSADQRAAGNEERDRVLVDYRLAATALRQSRDEVAKARLDDAIARIGGIISNDAQAARARGLFAAESTKIFIGEPYERVMAYYYRGILYWRDGQPDNARACFRSGQVIDSDPEVGHYDADYLLLDYLEGLASAKLQADGSDAYRRAQEHAGKRFTLPPYNPAANVLLFAEFGYGPRKYAAGQYGEQLKFLVNDSPTRSARLILAESGQVVPLPGYDDLDFQASTRGGRVMDHILGNKAVFKSTTSVAGDVAFAGSALALEQGRRREREGKDSEDADLTALGLGVLGMIGKAASAATQTRADTRQWDNLPQYLSFAALTLPPGDHRARLEFLDREGRVLERRTQEVTLSVAPGPRDTVVFLSELKH